MREYVYARVQECVHVCVYVCVCVCVCVLRHGDRLVPWRMPAPLPSAALRPLSTSRRRHRRCRHRQHRGDAASAGVTLPLAPPRPSSGPLCFPPLYPFRSPLTTLFRANLPTSPFLSFSAPTNGSFQSHFHPLVLMGRLIVREKGKPSLILIERVRANSHEDHSQNGMYL